MSAALKDDQVTDLSRYMSALGHAARTAASELAYAEPQQKNQALLAIAGPDGGERAALETRIRELGLVGAAHVIDPLSGALVPGDLDGLLTDRTRMVAFPHCSNVVAVINPVAQITAKAHAAGAIVVVDGVAWAPHGLPDVGGLDADLSGTRRA